MKIYPDEKAVDLISRSIINSTRKNKTLWIVPGGSASFYVIKIWNNINADPQLNRENLKILLTDERFFPEKNPESNFWNLIEKDFCLDPKIFKNCYQDFNLEKATKKYLKHTKLCFRWSEFKIGIFGVGQDGHTAGILPNKHELFACKELIFGYETEKFTRMTLTPKAILQIDFSFIIANGLEKKEIIKNLLKVKGDLENFPALIHHKIKESSIFTNII